MQILFSVWPIIWLIFQILNSLLCVESQSESEHSLCSRRGLSQLIQHCESNKDKIVQYFHSAHKLGVCRLPRPHPNPPTPNIEQHSVLILYYFFRFFVGVSLYGCFLFLCASQSLHHMYEYFPPQIFAIFRCRFCRLMRALCQLSKLFIRAFGMRECGREESPRLGGK